MSVFSTRPTGLFPKLVLGLLLASGIASQPVAAQTIYGLEFAYLGSGSRLFSFTAANPGTILAQPTITGVASGQTLAGIDFRPATGELYALGYDATAQMGQLYSSRIGLREKSAKSTKLV